MLEDALEEPGLLVDDGHHLANPVWVRFRVGLPPAFKGELRQRLEQVWAQPFALRVAAGDEAFVEVRSLSPGGDAEHGVLFRREVVEERAPGDPDLLAELLNSEAGEAVVEGSSAGCRRELAARLRHLAGSKTRCTICH